MRKWNKWNEKQLRRRLAVMAMAGVLTIVYTGCGGSGSASDSVMAVANSSQSAGGYYDYGEYEAFEEGIYMTEANNTGSYKDTGAAEQQTRTSDRKLIKTVNMTVETKEFDSLLATVERRVEELGGYIESLDTYNGSAYSSYRRSRNANLTLRVPKDKLEEFLSEVAEVGNVVSRSESVEDVTLTYVDLESHKKTLLTEQDRLLELLEQAESIEDIITIESRLSNVQYQIESMESQLRTFDNKVDYSTVYLYIDEVEELTPVEVVEETVWERITGGFMQSLSNVGRGLREFCIWFVVHIPYFILWAVIIAVIILAGRPVYKYFKARNEKKRAARRAARPAYMPTGAWQGMPPVPGAGPGQGMPPAPGAGPGQGMSPAPGAGPEPGMSPASGTDPTEAVSKDVEPADKESWK